MRNKFAKSLAAIGSTIVLGIIANFIYDSVKQIPVLGAVTHFFKLLYELGVRVLDWEIKLWVILLIVASVFMLRMLVRSANADTKPAFTKYKKDKFRVWIWKWNWRSGENGWRIIDLRPFCPDCDVELVDKSYSGHISNICPKCQLNYRFDEPEEEISRLIAAKVEKGGIY